jgi:glycosyltransferase involved in cell wall biosynthesis
MIIRNTDKSFDNLRVLHLTFDFPDVIEPKKTKAVYNLTTLGTSENNLVISLNRTSNPFSDFSLKKNKNCYALKIFGLPFGILLSLWMLLVSKKLLKLIKEENIKFDVIHAHKLSYEGIIAKIISKNLKIPYIVTVRGGTDQTLIRYKIHYYWLYKGILENSKKIIYLSPWTFNFFSKKFNNSHIKNKSEIIPNIIDLNSNGKDRLNQVATGKFVSVFHLKNYKIKNIKRTIEAINFLHDEFPELNLDIIGGGSKGTKIIESYIKKCKHPEKFTLIGNKPHQEVLKMYYQYDGFVLPSYPETFGLVFIEAVNSGLPIIYAKNSGIDGYFDEWRVGEKVDHSSISEIAMAIKNIYLRNALYRFSILEGIKKGELLRFSPYQIKHQYLQLLNKCIEEPNSCIYK